MADKSHLGPELTRAEIDALVENTTPRNTKEELLIPEFASYPARPRRMKIEISSWKVLSYSIYARACFYKTNERGSANEEVL